MLRAPSHFLLAHAYNSLPLFLSLSLSLTGKQGPLFTGQRERERERERFPELLSLFLKGITGALASFGYLVYHKNVKVRR
jgi:hypothetical protein